MPNPTVLEICAGAGGQAIGLEAAGFYTASVVEIDVNACDTLRTNRPTWRVIQSDVREVSGREFRGIELFAAGVPCPPFSIAGKQLGSEDERDLFPEALRLIEESQPTAVMLENVPGFATARFEPYRRKLIAKLRRLGYDSDWRILNACWFGTPQLRPRFVLVALKPKYADRFFWPEFRVQPKTVGEAIGDLMSSRGWRGATRWRRTASGIAPTIVGGSKKHGGPDLGPSRAKRQWETLGVDGMGIADQAPGREHPADHKPRLTVPMVARLQGFPAGWIITGKKTAAYRQIGNAFPPPVAEAVATAIREAIDRNGNVRRERQAPLFEELPEVVV